MRRISTARTIMVLLSTSLVVSALTFMGQRLNVRLQNEAPEPKLVAVSSLWRHHPTSWKELDAISTTIVVAQVTSVNQNQDFVKQIPAEDGPGEDLRVRSQDIILKVLKRLKGDVGDTVTVYYSGIGAYMGDGADPDLFIANEDPPYRVGETYVLFLEPNTGRPETYWIVSPEGRFRVVDGKLEPMSKEPFAAAMRGKSVEALEQELEKARR